MKAKIDWITRWISVGLLLSFFVCYLEWGTDNHGFLLQMEYSFFFSGKDVIGSFQNPFIVVPFVGQLLLLFAVFQKKPSARLVLIGLLLLSVLVLMITLVGVLSMNLKIVSSTLPFIIIAVSFFFLRFRNRKMNQ